MQSSNSHNNLLIRTSSIRRCFSFFFCCTCSHTSVRHPQMHTLEEKLIKDCGLLPACLAAWAKVYPCHPPTDAMTWISLCDLEWMARVGVPNEHNTSRCNKMLTNFHKLQPHSKCSISNHSSLAANPNPTRLQLRLQQLRNYCAGRQVAAFDCWQANLCSGSAGSPDSAPSAAEAVRQFVAVLGGSQSCWKCT